MGSGGGAGGSGSPAVTVTPSQAWAILKRHARDEVAPLRLRELCRDKDRVSSLVAVHNTEYRRRSSVADGSDANNDDDNTVPAGGTATAAAPPPQQYTIIVDLSRQRMTDATLNHLLGLAAAQQLKAFITRIAWGQNNPRRPVQPQQKAQNNNNDSNDKDATGGGAATASNSKNRSKNSKSKKPQVKPMLKQAKMTYLQEFQRAAENTLKQQQQTEAQQQQQYDPDSDDTMLPSMHLALRVPAGGGYAMFSADGVNVLDGIHGEWRRIRDFAEAVRRNAKTMIRDVVVVGRGTAVAALQFVYQALQKDERADGARRYGMAGGTTPNELASSLSHAASQRLRLLTGTAGVGGSAGAGGGSTGPSQPHPPSSAASGTHAGRRLRFLTSLDPNAAAALTAELDPAATLVVSVALEGNEETGLVTSTLKNWLIKSMGGSSGGGNRKTDWILAKHMILITGNERVANVINKPESVYLIPEHSRCEAFTSFSVATLLPLAVVFGWPLVQDFLGGAHDMDRHFVETNPRHNLPVLLALTDVWNDAFLDATARAVTPFHESLAAFPAFVAALEAQTCGRSPSSSSSGGSSSSDRPSCSSMILDGGLDGSLDRALYQSGKIVNSELVMAIDSQTSFNAARTIGAHGMESVHSAQDALMCSFFAHADELAFGGHGQHSQHPQTPAYGGEHSFSFSPASVASGGGGHHHHHHHTKQHHPSNEPFLSKGNRPSVLLLCGRLDAFACGQLVALSEHRAVVKAHLWGIDPFVREGGPSLRMARTEELKGELEKMFASPPDGGGDNEEDDDDAADDSRMNFSTKTILGHYANSMRNQR